MHELTRRAPGRRCAAALGAFAWLSGCASSASQTASDAGALPVDASADAAGGPADAAADSTAAGPADGGAEIGPAVDAGDAGVLAACHGDPTPFPCMPNSIFYQPLPSSPKLAPNSSAIFSYYASSFDLDTPSAAIWNKGIHLFPDPLAQPDGNQAAAYFARATDPVMTVKCFEPWCAGGHEAIDGVQIHVPAGARWQNYPDCADAGPNDTQRGSCGDDHFEVISPDGKPEYDLYEAFGCFQNGSTCLIGAGQFEDYATSNGFATNGVANATGWVPTQGLVLPSEILAGAIPHALALMFPCHDGSFVPPARASDGAGAACPVTTNVLTEGQRLFLAASDAQIASWGNSGVTGAGQIVLRALAHYGGYYVDNQGYGGMTFWTINSYGYAAPGTLTDRWPQVASQFSLPRTADGQSYDLGIENVPGGISTWLRACDKTGC